MKLTKIEVNDLYSQKDLKKYFIDDLVDSFSTIPNTFVQHKYSLIAKGLLSDILIFKSPKLYAIDVMFDIDKHRYLPLFEKYKRNDIDNINHKNFDPEKRRQVMLDENNNKEVISYGNFKLKDLLRFKKISENKNIYCGYIIAYKHQDTPYYVSFNEIWNKIHLADDVNPAITEEWLEKYGIKLELVKKNTAWLNEDLEILRRCALDGYTPEQVARKYKDVFQGKSKKLIKMRYIAMQEKKNYKTNKTYVNYIYGTDEILKDIRRYHKLYEDMREEEEKRKGWDK